MNPRRRFSALLRRFSAEQDGVAAIEFALGAVMLFGLSIGIVDVGRYMFTVNAIEHASKEGARYAAIHSPGSVNPKTDAQIVTFIENSAIGMDVVAMTPDITWSDPVTYAPGSRVTIQVDHPFNFFYAGIFSTTPFTLSAQSTYTVGR